MIKFGVKLNVHGDYVTLKRLVQECERLGFYSAFMYDHPSRPFLECWTTLSALATETYRIRLGPLVTCVSYRNPSLLAKMGATLDVISEGRLEFGIGAGWSKEEHISYGYRFPKTQTRVQQLKEAIEIIKMMWTQENPSYIGKHYSIKRAACNPKPIQKPHPPILVGGSGEKYVLGAVAELADICNISGSPAEYKRRLEILRNYCLELGRDFGKIEKSWTGDVLIVNEEEKAKLEKLKLRRFTTEQYLDKHIVGTLEECVSKIQAYIELGVTYFTVSVRTLKEDLELFADEVIKRAT